MDVISFNPQQLNIDRRTDGAMLVNSRELLAIVDGKIKSIATLRLYMGRSRSASRVIANFWIHHAGMHAHASGSAGGYGYCKQSAAASEAMTAAGLSFSGDFHGAGMSAVDNALEAIARHYGLSVFHISRG